MALHNDLDAHLKKVVGVGNFTVTGNVATLPTGALDNRRIAELLDVASLIKHDVSLAAGVLTVKPR